MIKKKKKKKLKKKEKEDLADLPTWYQKKWVDLVTRVVRRPDTISQFFPTILTTKNHAFDMAILDIAQFNDALLIQVDPRMTPMCMFVLRQLTRDQMTSLFP